MKMVVNSWEKRSRSLKSWRSTRTVTSRKYVEKIQNWGGAGLLFGFDHPSSMTCPSLSEKHEVGIVCRAPENNTHREAPHKKCGCGCESCSKPPISIANSPLPSRLDSQSTVRFRIVRPRIESEEQRTLCFFERSSVRSRRKRTRFPFRTMSSAFAGQVVGNAVASVEPNS